MNEELMNKLSIYLNECPDYINENMINDINSEHLFSEEETVRIIVASLFNMYENKKIMDSYFRNTFNLLDIHKYQNNLYYKNIKLDDINYHNWSVKEISYKPYELFVYDDLKEKNNCVIPSIGFFNEEFKYPAIYQNNRIWMLITPNEINTMDKPINEAYGDVLTYGLGLGYYAYMVSLKDSVKSITIVENDAEVISLFEKYILPQFKNKDKIKIINDDAIKYASKKLKYDYVFADIWHDPTDGVELYKKIKVYERCDTKYSYWIYNTLKYYMED